MRPVLGQRLFHIDNHLVVLFQQQMTAADQVAAIQAMLAADRLKQARPVMGTPLSSSAAMQSARRPIVKGGWAGDIQAVLDYCLHL